MSKFRKILTTPIKSIYLTSTLLAILIVLYINADVKYVPKFFSVKETQRVQISPDLKVSAPLLVANSTNTEAAVATLPSDTSIPDSVNDVQNVRAKVGLSSELSLDNRKIDSDKVKELILGGIDVNSQDQFGYTPLMVASLRGLKEIVELLIAHGADINARANLRETSLICAAERGHLEIAALLLSKGADINAADQNKRTPLSAATVYGKKQMVEFLISKGADISGNKPQRLLIFAIGAGQMDLVKLYLSLGADVKSKDAFFETTPIMRAAESGRTEIAELLISKGADADTKSNNGYSALMSAIYYGHKETARLLISRGANVNAATTDEMKTPLHYAAIQGRKEIVELLVSKGANVNAKDRSGKTPLLYAYELVRKEIQDILIANGAIDDRPKDEFVVVVRENAQLKLLPQTNAKTADTASIGDYLKYLENTNDHKWVRVSKNNNCYWTYHDNIYREPSKLVASIIADFQDVRGKGSLTPNPKMLFAMSAGVERLDYSAAMENWDKQLLQELEQKDVISSYAINSEMVIKSLNEKLILSKTIVRDMGCYSSNTEIGSDISLLNEKSYEVNANKFSQSFSLPRKDIFSTKLQGDVLNAKLIYIFNIKYINGTAESVVRTINLRWSLCM